jgi:AcrR family transcriptional regulator
MNPRDAASGRASGTRAGGKARRAKTDPDPTLAGDEEATFTRRQEIVALARATIVQRGYTNTSMRDIAEAAGLLAGSLYSHFRSKSEILRLILEPLLDRLVPAQEAVLHAGGPGLDRLGRMIHDVLVILAEHPEEITILHYDWSELASLEEVASVADRSNHLLELWRATVVDGITDGSIRGDVAPDVIVRTITSSLHASVDRLRYQALPRQESVAPDVKALSRQLQILFSSGLAAAPKSGSRSRKSRPAEA